MPDPTPVAMYLKQVVETWVSADDDGTELEQAIDDAGVREAVEKLEHLIDHVRGFPYVHNVAKQALSSLTGETQEVSDGT